MTEQQLVTLTALICSKFQTATNFDVRGSRLYFEFAHHKYVAWYEDGAINCMEAEITICNGLQCSATDFSRWIASTLNGGKRNEDGEHVAA